MFSIFRLTLHFKSELSGENSIKRTKSNSDSKHFDNCVKIEHLSLHIIGTHHKKFGEKNQYILCRVSNEDTRRRLALSCVPRDTRQRSRCDVQISETFLPSVTIGKEFPECF
jgi:hypothetical protein